MRFDVIKHHRIWFAISALAVILSIVSMVMNGFNLGIDYTGGSIMELRFQQDVQVSQVRESLKSFGLENSVIQLSGETTAETGKDVIIRTRNLESTESQAIAEAITKDVGPNEVKRIETVGAVIGSEVTKNAILNLAVAFIALALYISYRFEYKIAL